MSQYTNSPLVSYTKIAPPSNHYGKRNHKIDTITIHCYVGQVTVERAGDGFSNPKRGASCNYVVGYDGRIGLILPEEYASGCTSNQTNDERAITIEVACDSFHPYAVTDAAYSSLVDLVADICKRNGIKQLLWRGDKKLIGKVDKQNMTVHRWFAAKACPGDWLYQRHGEISAKVNEKLKEEKTMTYEQWKLYMERYRKELGAEKPASWAVPSIHTCIDAGLMAEVNGGIDRPGDFLTRQEAAVMAASTLVEAKK